MAARTNRQWLIFELSDQAYGFAVEHVREIVSLRKMPIHRLPQTSAVVEGVVVLRDHPIEAVDVRSSLGLCSLRKETEGISQLLQEREADHCRWIQELEACVHERREFRLATDPHKCKFGQWYDKLRSDSQALARLANGDLALNSLLEQLDKPHQRIHAIAHQVLSHVTDGRVAQAGQIIDETRNTELSALRVIFSKCREQIQLVRRGLLLVFAEEHGMVGGIVDRVSEVATLSDDEIRPVPGTHLANCVLTGLAQRSDTSRMIQLLDVSAVVGWRTSQPDSRLSHVA